MQLRIFNSIFWRLTDIHLICWFEHASIRSAFLGQSEYKTYSHWFMDHTIVAGAIVHEKKHCDVVFYATCAASACGQKLL